MKKNLILLTGLLAISFSGSIFSYIYKGVNFTNIQVKLDIATDWQWVGRVILEPYGKEGFIKEVDFNTLYCFKWVARNQGVLYDFKGLGCRNVQQEISFGPGMNIVIKDVPYGKSDY